MQAFSAIADKYIQGFNIQSYTGWPSVRSLVTVTATATEALLLLFIAHKRQCLLHVGLTHAAV